MEKNIWMSRDEAQKEVDIRNKKRETDRKIMSYIFIIIFFIAISFASMLIYSAKSHNGWYSEENPILLKADSSLANTIEVAQLENKFIEVKAVGFGGGAAGGQGAPEIVANSALQFTELVAAEEPIYIVVEYFKDFRANSRQEGILVTYWAFIENRAGVVVFEELTKMPDSTQGWELKRWDTTTNTALYINNNEYEMTRSAIWIFVASSILYLWSAWWTFSLRGHKRSYYKMAYKKGFNSSDEFMYRVRLVYNSI